ncbi:NAD(P)H-binding protein [Streptomyces armeniacus]|nr:NAD(P)H-binding protein [Streptomyces armeniacus]
MIAVTGATGNVGSALVAQLAAEGRPVRALSRRPDRTRLPEGGSAGAVDAVRADFADPPEGRGLEALFEGATGLFLHVGAVGGSTRSVVEAATRAGVRRIVVLSSGAISGHGDGGTADEANPIAAFHLAAERAVRAAAPEWTLLRPNAFAANAFSYAPQIRAGGDVVRGPYARAAMAPVHERDMAAVAAHALLNDGPEHAGRDGGPNGQGGPGSHHGAVHRLTGPASVTTAEQVRLIGDALGRPLRFEEVPEENAAEELYADMPRPFLRVMLDAFAASVGTPPEITTTVEDVTGVPARTFAEWAADHTADFR